MTVARPVRLQRRRKKGFDLQAVSRGVNGLSARAVTRLGEFGNPFRVGGYFRVGGASESWIWQWADRDHADARFTFIETPAQTVAMFAEMQRVHGRPNGVEALIGLNLACFCRLCTRHATTGKPLDEDCPDCQPCHVDPLGKRVLALTCEGV